MITIYFKLVMASGASGSSRLTAYCLDTQTRFRSAVSAREVSSRWTSYMVYKGEAVVKKVAINLLLLVHCLWQFLFKTG